MSLLTAFATEAAPLLLNDWGEAVTYFPADGSSSRSITVAMMRSVTAQEDRASHKLLVKTCQVSAYDNATTGISAPAVGDGITDGAGVRWDFGSVVDRNGGMWLLEYQSAAIAETGTPTQADV